MKSNSVRLLLLLSLVVPVVAHGHGDQFMINVGYNDHGVECYGHNSYHNHYLPSERYLRRQLYWLYRNNPHCLNVANFPIDYFLATVTEHIHVLENKITAKKSGLRSNAMLRGTVISAISLLWGYITYDSYSKRDCAEKPEEVIIATVILGAVSTLLAAIAGSQFDRVYRHAERLVERLERDKHVLIALEKAKAARESGVGNAVAPALQLINSGIYVLNSLTQLLTVPCVIKS